MLRERTYLNDTVVIPAVLYGEDGVNPRGATSALLSVKAPDGTVITQTISGLIQAQIEAVFGPVTQPGLHTGSVQFSLTTGEVQSVPVNFEVIDPLKDSQFTTLTPAEEIVIDRAWMKLEDLYDSELGGPHLRDRTLASFDRDKLARLIPDALYGINNTFQPALDFTEASFPFDEHGPLLTQAILVEGIYQLMRSYSEQPTPVNSNVPWFDRRDYLARWQSILTLEETKLNKWLDLFKLAFFGFGSTSMLVGGYASYPTRYPRYMRGRYPYVYRY